MLGWHITVYRQQKDGAKPATFETASGPQVARWETELGGLDWFDLLVEHQKAIDLGGDGYPSKYTAVAKFITEALRTEPPPYLRCTWSSKKICDAEVMDACDPEEWLIVQVFDLS